MCRISFAPAAIEQADKGDHAVILTNYFCTKDEPGKKSNYLGKYFKYAF